MSTKRPGIKILQDFTRKYFPRRCPIVRWKKMDCLGIAVRSKNLIYLNPDASPKDHRCKVGTGWYVPIRKIKMKGGEQYFLTLLHEIGHFKIKKNPPKGWITLRRKLIKEAREHLKIEKTRDKKFGQYKPKTEKEKKRYIDEYVHYNADFAMKRRRAEGSSQFYGRLQDFRDWFMGDMMSEHVSVEDWARKEFLKCRKNIKILLAGDNIF